MFTDIKIDIDIDKKLISTQRRALWRVQRF